MVRIAAFVGALIASREAAHAQDAAETVRFQLRDLIILVEVTVNGKGPFLLAFDTGSALTVLKPETAKKAGLVGNLIEVNSLSVGRAVARKVQVTVKALPQDDLPPCDGVLGATFISRFVSTIDYTARTIRLVPGTSDSQAQGSLGFSYRTIPDDLASEIGLEGGLEVRAIAVGGPAAKGGLRRGDIIREIKGMRVDTADQYRAQLASIKPGDAVLLKVVRERKDVEVKVTASERP